MKVSYDKEGDILYIKLNNKRIYKTKEIGSDFLIDVSKNSDIVGIEILDYSKQKSRKDRFQISTGDKKIAIPAR